MTVVDKTNAPAPVSDPATDYDIFEPGYIEKPFEVWDELRQKCPIAHTERWGGSWLPTTMEDVRELAKNTDVFTSFEVGVAPRVEDENDGIRVPPIDSDPPEHTWARRLILPFFSPQAVARYEDYTRETCRSLIASFRDRGHADAAGEYAQQIPGRVISTMIGVPADMTDLFTHWVREILEFGGPEPDRRIKARGEMIAFLIEQVETRAANPGEHDDILAHLLAAEVEGQPVPKEHILGTLVLLLLAGVDTTWSAIGSSLHHLATHPEDRQRLVAEPELLPTAIEELLRAYSPVTMARIVSEDTEYKGCPMKQGDRVLMSFPAANRDPEAFENADQVIIDRERNRHVAFGVGIHRCAGSNLARMELRVALGEWLRAIPEFTLDTTREMSWAGGQVRGPRFLPVTFPVTDAG